jgi:NADH-quinone oxidoreductase subunit J
MTAINALFWVFATITVLSALRVVTARNPVHAALFLVLAFFSSACIWMLLKAEFLAITLVLVYVGAVMVLFLFVVMMLDVNMDQVRQGFMQHLFVALSVGVVILMELLSVLWHLFKNVKQSDAPPEPANFDNTKALGKLLYSDYIYPVEIASVILLVGMVAAIALTLRKRKDSKSQIASEQIKVKAKDRIEIVKMKAVSNRNNERNQDSTGAAK